MTLRFSAPIALLVLGSAAPALAEAPQTPPAQQSNPDDEVVCRVIKVTGSRLGATRTCLTRAQWRQQRQDHREEADRVQRQRWSDFKDPPTPGDP
jgi:hypothetical protein